MAETALRPVDAAPDFGIVEQVIIKGDLSKLSPQERADYYMRVCTSVGLNPFTKPFEYITLNGKLTLYALKGAADQLRDIHGISILETKTDYLDDLLIVTVSGQDKTGRRDSEIGAVTIGGLRGDAKANALMKALTKAKRRLTLSMCGLGMLDSTELETIPNARPYDERPATSDLKVLADDEVVDHDTREIVQPARPAPVDDPERRKVANDSVFAVASNKGLLSDDVKRIAYDRYHVDSMTKLTIANLRDFWAYLNKEDPEYLQNLSDQLIQQAEDATFTEVPE